MQASRTVWRTVTSWSSRSMANPTSATKAPDSKQKEHQAISLLVLHLPEGSCQGVRGSFRISCPCRPDGTRRPPSSRCPPFCGSWGSCTRLASCEPGICSCWARLLLLLAHRLLHASRFGAAGGVALALRLLAAIPCGEAFVEAVVTGLLLHQLVVVTSWFCPSWARNWAPSSLSWSSCQSACSLSSRDPWPSLPPALLALTAPRLATSADLRSLFLTTGACAVVVATLGAGVRYALVRLAVSTVRRSVPGLVLHTRLPSATPDPRLPTRGEDPNSSAERRLLRGEEARFGLGLGRLVGRGCG